MWPHLTTLISDNGPYYHNSEMMIIMAHWKDWYDIEIMHAIKRYVRIGFEIREGSDIENSIKDLYSISVGEINPNHEKTDKKIKSLVGISNMNKWKWPINGPFAGSI
ncbi:unnamed protein product [Rhizophagus irregularis]|nr:unnamed protein product [Rhizophagus irregularis]